MQLERNNEPVSTQTFNDQILTCSDCGTDFTWTANEQEFYQSKGFQAPRRCRECRAKKKEQKQQHRYR